VKAVAGRVDKPWVLVTDGARNRASLAAVRALAKGGYRAAVAGSGASLASFSRYCERLIEVPRPGDEGYADAVRAAAAKGGYETVLPASDPAVISLEAGGRHLLDKDELARLATAVGMPTPPSMSFGSTDDLMAAADELQYPIIIKPRRREYAAMRVATRASLPTALRGGPVVVQPYVEGDLTAVSGIAWQGRVVAPVHQLYLRTWPPGAGTVCAAETIEGDRTIDDRLAALLSGYEGIFQAQFVGPYLIDVHPRVYSSHPLAVAAGVNLVAIWCDLLRGSDVPDVEARPGVLYRWVMPDLRHLLSSVRRHPENLGSLLWQSRPHRRSAHSVGSVLDPKPLLSRAYTRAVAATRT
jgi:predicted ATP-grasp superfamily ATP-dependent carboligase